MNGYLTPVRGGLFLAFSTLMFGIFLGVAFGVAEYSIKEFVRTAVSLHPDLHGPKSSAGIWRYAQRAHFHSAGIGAFTIGLIILVAFTTMRDRLKSATAILIGLGGLYPLSWFSMFLLAPSMGARAAHGALPTEFLAYAGTGCLLVGIAMLAGNLFLGWGSASRHQVAVAE